VDEARTGRRDRKKQQTRQALIEAALRLVDERGLDHVTVEDIADAADVSPRTFFNYFASKDEAITGDLFVEDDGTGERLLSAAPGVPVVEAFLQAMAPGLTAMQDDRDVWFLRMRVMEANPSLILSLIARSSAAENQLVQVVGKRLGLSQAHPYPAVFAAAAGGAVRTAMMRWPSERRPLTDLVDEAFSYLATGLADPRTGDDPHDEQDPADPTDERRNEL
jgi:AcrR family transcriptional regulator